MTNQPSEPSRSDSPEATANPAPIQAVARGRAVPPFAQAYPEAPELDLLLAVFQAGNYAEVRRLAPQMLQRAKDPAVQKAITDLRNRIEPEPMALYLLGLTAALLAFLTAWFYLHNH